MTHIDFYINWWAILKAIGYILLGGLCVFIFFVWLFKDAGRRG